MAPSSSTWSKPLAPPPRAVLGAIESAVVRQQIHRKMAAPTDETSDEQQSDKDVATPVKKKRKPTYYMRKDEMAQLQEELAMLQKKLKSLEGQPRYEQRSVVDSIQRHQGLRERIQQGDLTVAKAQSLVSSYGPKRHSPPIGDFIHLTKHSGDRRRTLNGLKMSKMRDATHFILARSQYVDVTKTSRQVETFELDGGSFITTHWEITPLQETTSARQAFDQLKYFMDTQELSMSEKLGVLTIRDNEAEPVDEAHTVRMVSSYDNGVQVESNVAIFAHFFERSEDLEQPYGLLIVDYVDQDDLLPSQPASRVRKDVSSVTMIAECPDVGPGACPVVTMLRWAFIRVNHNPLVCRNALEYVAREGVGKWFEVMLGVIREKLTSR